MNKGIQIIILVLCISLIAPNIFALASCVTMSTGGVNEISTQKDVPNYVSLRIYNSSAQAGTICENGNYVLTAEILSVNDNSSLSVDAKVSDYFNYSFSENNFDLTNGENKQILLTLNPIQDGTYKIKIITTKQPVEGAIGTSIISSTSANITVNVGDGLGEITGGTAELPFWTTHKNCPDGTVVENTETCENSSLVTSAFGLGAIDGNTIVVGLVILICLVIVVLAIFKGK